jgi:hypothetical protein
MTSQEIRTLCQANERRGWQEVPETCPERFRTQIAEYRVAVMKGTLKETRITKNLHSVAVKGFTEQEKYRLKLIAAGVL